MVPERGPTIAVVRRVIGVVAVGLRHAIKVAYDRLTGLLPARAAGAFDTALDSFRTWSGPFNGQNARQQIIRDLVFSLRIEQFVETGTFRGTTTEFLANLLGAPVFTVESQPRYFSVAKKRLAQYPWVTVELGDSRSFLRSFASKKELCAPRTLFYLDAHWERDLPLHDELAIIVEGWPNAVVVIDDFEVPDDPGYAFDDYGPGRRISIDNLPELPGWALLFPSVSSGEETGARRGCAVLASPSMAYEAAAIPTLRG
jgi:predicted O-methyltransferase YrrM